jgi:LemA protein
MDTLWYIAIGIDLLLSLYIIRLYNRLIGAKNEIDNMMGSIDAILKKRFDLIPNLVSAVREYSVFERSLLERLTEIRSWGMHPEKSIKEKSALSSSMSDVLRRFNLTVENYPALKANVSFIHLQKTIAILEEELSAARRAYNQSVTDYNNQREMFPSNLMAMVMRLKAKEVFKTTQCEQSLPQLSTLFQTQH